MMITMRMHIRDNPVLLFFPIYFLSVFFLSLHKPKDTNKVCFDEDCYRLERQKQKERWIYRSDGLACMDD